MPGVGQVSLQEMREQICVADVKDWTQYGGRIKMEINQEIKNPYFTQFSIMAEQISLMSVRIKTLETQIGIMDKQIFNLTKIGRLNKIHLQEEIRSLRGY